MKSPSPLGALDANQRYSLDEAFRYLRVGRARGFEKLKTGELRSFKEGKRRYVTGLALMQASQPPA